MEGGGKFGLEKRLTRDPAWMNHPLAEKFFRNIPVIILVGSLFLLYGYFLAHKIDLTTADLGRHIKNGELLLSDSSLLSQNIYSYTHPDFPVVNHHWGSGLLFYWVWKASGFVGVHLFFILLSLAALAAFLATARLYANWGIIGFITLVAIPLLGERTEIRPEVFSYLFAGLFFLILCRYRETTGHPLANTYGRKYSLTAGVWLWALPLIEIAWVNTHIYFLLGPLLVGAFLLVALLRYTTGNSTIYRTVAEGEVSAKKQLKTFCILFLMTTGATLVNPFGYRAVTDVLTFFQNFGYRLAENQSVWFLERLGMANPNFVIFQIALLLLAFSYALVLVRNRAAFRLADFFIAAGMSTLAIFAVRNFALFGLFLIPILAGNVAALFPAASVGKRLARTAAGCAVAVFLLSIAFALPRYFPYWRGFGFGLEAGNDAPALFLKEQKIQGPIFNNYDIGGYLIFYLFPREKVFVDNRPEAYPASFFQEEYIPMQEDDAVWKKELARNNFNAIAFSYRDATPWGQKFLVSRITDPEWAPVYVDDRVLVFLRRTKKNEEIIKTREIPRERFLFR